MKFFYLVPILLFTTQTLFAHNDELSNLSVEELYEQADIVPTGEASFITLGNDSLYAQEQSLTSRNLLKVVTRGNSASILQIDNAALGILGDVNHMKFKRCAGYFFHNTLKEAQEHLMKLSRVESLTRAGLQHGNVFQNSRMTWNGGGAPPDSPSRKTDYSINQQSLVNSMLGQVEEVRIRASINKLSSFKNRYYTSPTGVQAAEWIAEEAKKITARRNDIKVELFKHAQWSQPSVIITIQGSSAETVVIGGHLDSINAGIMGGGGPDKLAPGADDNASGISTWLEVLRILMDNNYKPQKTLQFMGYAAEEVGLRGSNEIAKKYFASKVPVIGVVQLDMTNFKGADKSVYLMTDYTNADQNTFVGKLIDEYVKVPWGFDKCGYGCSDHASWHNQGYAASMPFEATMRGMNRNIHTTEDKIEISGSNAHHAVNFAKLALAFAIELDR